MCSKPFGRLFACESRASGTRPSETRRNDSERAVAGDAREGHEYGRERGAAWNLSEAKRGRSASTRAGPTTGYGEPGRPRAPACPRPPLGARRNTPLRGLQRARARRGGRDACTVPREKTRSASSVGAEAGDTDRAPRENSTPPGVMILTQKSGDLSSGVKVLLASFSSRSGTKPQ